MRRILSLLVGLVAILPAFPLHSQESIPLRADSPSPELNRRVLPGINAKADCFSIELTIDPVVEEGGDCHAVACLVLGLAEDDSDRSDAWGIQIQASESDWTVDWAGALPEETHVELCFLVHRKDEGIESMTQVFPRPLANRRPFLGTWPFFSGIPRETSCRASGRSVEVIPSLRLSLPPNPK